MTFWWTFSLSLLFCQCISVLNLVCKLNETKANMVTVVEIAGVSAGISKYSMYLGHIHQYQPWKWQENLVEHLFSFATFELAWLVTILLLRRFKFSRVFSAYRQLSFFCKQPFRNLNFITRCYTFGQIFISGHKNSQFSTPSN